MMSLTKLAKENMQDMEELLDIYRARIKQLDAEVITLRQELKKLNQYLTGQHE